MINRRSLSASSTRFRNSHSQTTKKSHPSVFSSTCCRRSRSRLLWSLGPQKSRRDFGSRANLQVESGCRCQKQPCTKMALRRLRKTRSGAPGRRRSCRRYRKPMAWTKRRTSISGLLSRLRTRAIRALRAAGLRVSIWQSDRFRYACQHFQG